MNRDSNHITLVDGIYTHTGTTKNVRLNLKSGRKFTCIMLLFEIVYDLLKQNKKITQREVYYMNSFFKSQSETDESILDVSGFLNVPRAHLHIIGTTKGIYGILLNSL